MKRFLIAGAALLISTSLSTAADLGMPEPEPAVVPFSWTGFYIGIHGGGAFGDSGFDDDDDWTEDPDFSPEGFVIGGQVGYNWQWDWFVLGLEADGSFADMDDDDEIDHVDWGLVNPEIETDFLASVRGRLGFAFDRFLVYGTGGVAFTGLSFDDGVDDDDDNDFTGWAAGGGIEWAFADNFSLGVEFIHYEFDDEDFDTIVFPDNNGDFSTDVIRGRLNWKFDTLFQ